jgi:pSer/pThr/pTyr-binding forkhead associated (FHA) protein
MSGKDRSGQSQTILDERMAPRRLKESLVPPDTGIYLRIEEGPLAGKVYTLSSGGIFLIGREGADIVIDDSKVSRKHAEVGLYGPGAYVVRDLASTNGTLLNDRRVDDRAKLSHWDRIQVGDTTLRFAVLDDSIPLS